MSNPTWQNVLTSVLTRTEKPVQVSILEPVQVAWPSGESWRDLEDRVNQLEGEIRVLQDLVAEQKTIILVFIDLRLAFVADWPIAKLLGACGIEEAAALAGQDPQALHERMERENKKRRFMDSVPPVKQLESWVQAIELASQWAPSGGQSGAADS